VFTPAPSSEAGSAPGLPNVTAGGSGLLFGASGIIWRDLIPLPSGATSWCGRSANIQSPGAASQARSQPDSSPVREPSVWLLMAGFVCANFVATIFLTWTRRFWLKNSGSSSRRPGSQKFVHSPRQFFKRPIGESPRTASRGAGPADESSSRRADSCRQCVHRHGRPTREVPTLIAAMTCFGLCKGVYDSNISLPCTIS